MLQLNNGAENRFTLQLITEIMQALDHIDQQLDNLSSSSSSEGAAQGGALITTGGTSVDNKFYSNGLAIQDAMAIGDAFYLPYMRMLARLLTFRIPTVAAINGHAFAGGCMFALAHDYRVMRSDRGWIAMNEIDLGIPLIPGMAAIVRCKVKGEADLRDCVLSARRFRASEAVAAGFVDKAVEGDQLIQTATDYAKAMAPKARGLSTVFHLIKAEIYRDTVSLLLAGGTTPGDYLAKL
ncbi:hypothetical protein GGI21_000061 [Coemansia aciculifera]|nr:hypothetical protein GGI21_000061 [Coemansia aciculifera]